MESVLMGHPCDIIPFCIQDYRILDAMGNLLPETKGNYQTQNAIIFDAAVETDQIIIELGSPSAKLPAALFEVRCYQ